MEKLKNMKGITLIALVITIVVLLILAGVTIAMLTGDNGILTKAQSAKTKNAETTLEEQIKLSVMASRMNEDNNLGIDLSVLEEELKNNIDENVGINKKGENENLPWVVAFNGYSFKIDSDGKIEKVNGIILTKSNIKIVAGRTGTIGAELTQGVTGNISWSSSGNPGVTVSGDNSQATVTIAEGTTETEPAIITAKIDGTEYSAKCSVKVILDVTNATVGSDLSVEIGSTLDIAKCITNIDSIEDFTITNVTGNATKENDTTIKGTGTEDGAATITITRTSSKITHDITVTVIKPVEPEVGDFVNYSAGNWTQADLIKLGVEFDGDGNITNNGDLYAGESVPTENTPCLFGGFKVGQSKDESITVELNYTSPYSGWRVLSRNDDRTYNIIHAGTPEAYYPSYGTCYKSQYILGGGINPNGTSSYDYTKISVRDWSMYENPEFAQGGSARSVSYAEMVSLRDSDTLKSVGSFYWLPLAPDSGHLYCVYCDSGIKDYNSYGWGVRPVVTLKSNVKFTAKAGDTTHKTEGTAWQLGTN